MSCRTLDNSCHYWEDLMVNVKTVCGARSSQVTSHSIYGFLSCMGVFQGLGMEVTDFIGYKQSLVQYGGTVERLSLDD